MLQQIILSLLLAIRTVESADGLDPNAYGNDYQITSICVRDVNRIYGTRYSWPKDVLNRETARDIVILYLTYYGNVYRQEYGKIPSRDTLARIYHRGYRGMKHGEGQDYAKKITSMSDRTKGHKKP